MAKIEEEGVFTVKKFRKRPIVVEAVQWQLGDIKDWPDVPDGVVYDEDSDSWYCETLEGLAKLSGGEWIVTGAIGEHYPVQDAIFKLTYLPVVEGEEEPERMREEIIFAHDLIKSLLAGEVPGSIPSVHNAEIWQAALNALCWVLGHEYGKVLQGNIELIHKTLKKGGVDFASGTDFAGSHPPDAGPGTFSLN